MFFKRLTSIDIFGQPFQFRTGTGLDKPHRAKKTFFGSMISIFCYIVAILYLVFLLEEYFSGRIPPAVSEKSVNMTGTVTEQFDKNPFNIKINLPNTMATENISQYLNVWVNDIGPLKTASEIIKPPTPKTINKQIQYLYTIDDSVKLQSNAEDKTQNQSMQVVIQKCRPGGTVTCKTDAEIDAVLQNDDTEIEIQLFYSELEIKTGKFVEKYDDIFSAIEPGQVQFLDLQLLVGKVDVDQGFITKSSTISKYVKGFYQHSGYYSQNYIDKRFGVEINSMIDAFKVINVRLARQSHEMIVVYEKFSQLLAKYTAIFHTLIIIGLVAKMGSHAKIFEMLLDTYILSYYKSTAAQIHAHKQEKKQKNNNISKVSDSNANNKSFSTLFPKKYTDLLCFNTIKSTIKHQLGYIFYELHENKIEKIKNGEIKMTEEATSSDTHKTQQQKNKEMEKLQEKIYTTQFKKVTEQLDFRTLYSEVYQIKAGLQLLFTPEQYAAIHYVGRNINLNEYNPLQNEDQKNHLEKIDLVEENQEYRDQKMFEYLKNKDKYNSDLDKKIQECLIAQVDGIMNEAKTFDTYLDKTNKPNQDQNQDQGANNTDKDLEHLGLTNEFTENVQKEKK